MQTGMITRLIREPPDKEYHLDVCGYQYPSPLMEPVIGNTVRGLKNNYGLVLNVLNVPNSTVAKRTILKEISNRYPGGTSNSFLSSKNTFINSIDSF